MASKGNNMCTTPPLYLNFAILSKTRRSLDGVQGHGQKCEFVLSCGVGISGKKVNVCSTVWTRREVVAGMRLPGWRCHAVLRRSSGFSVWTSGRWRRHRIHPLLCNSCYQRVFHVMYAGDASLSLALSQLLFQLRKCFRMSSDEVWMRVHIGIRSMTHFRESVLYQWLKRIA